jgi:hypothetical protein|tara:strand:+ start:6736 stop:7587 length:852 start_codon:yes stop_codon:yes gene_type:complete
MAKKKSIKTLVDDIYKVFEEYQSPSQEDLDTFSKNITEIVSSRIAERRERKQHLRLSQIGTPNRKLWYSMNTDQSEILSGQDRLKFMYGDLLEELLNLLIKTSGHKIEDLQKELKIDGVVGHQDCTIDGVVTDIKSASSFATKKFTDGSILRGNDPFGYVAQISAYAESQKQTKAAFLVINKENAALHLLELDFFDMINATDRVKELKQVVKNDIPPEKCYEDQAEGMSGNRVLNMHCSWCPYKFTCWSDVNNGTGLRVFKYAKGQRYFTNVSKEPNVQEITC